MFRKKILRDRDRPPNVTTIKIIATIGDPLNQTRNKLFPLALDEA
jgi:hypothetical protein